MLSRMPQARQEQGTEAGSLQEGCWYCNGGLCMWYGDGVEAHGQALKAREFSRKWECLRHPRRSRAEVPGLTENNQGVVTPQAQHLVFGTQGKGQVSGGSPCPGVSVTHIRAIALE